MAFGNTADRRIARHLCDTGRIHRQEERGCAHPGGRQRGFAARMPPADDDHVKPLRHGVIPYFPIQNVEKICSKTSSVVMAPVISPRASAAARRSTATSSFAIPALIDSSAWTNAPCA